MPGTGIEVAAVRPWVQVARKVIPWALSRPFIARPAVWNVLTALCVLALVGAVVLGITSTPLFLALAVALGGLVAGGWGWLRLTKPSDRPIVYVTELAPASPGAAEAGFYHADAVKRRLEAAPLGTHVTVRLIPAALTREQAQRLLDHTEARAVIFGEVRALADTGTWKTEMLLQWPGDDSPDVAHVTPRLTVEMMKADRGKEAPVRHEWQALDQAPLGTLVADYYEAEDVAHVEATLLALAAAEFARDGDEDAALACLDAAEDRRAAMSPRTRASVELTRAELTDFAPSTDSLRALEAVGLADADHVDLWSFLVEMAYLGRLKGSVAIEEQVRYAERAVRAAPDDATAHYNLAEGYMAVDRREEALAEYDLSASDATYDGYYYVHLGRGVIHYNAGRIDEARKAYARAVELQPTAESHLFLADALRQQGHLVDAREHYLSALRLEPTLADAHRGYWSTLQPGEGPSAGKSFDRVFVFIDRVTGRINWATYRLTGRTPARFIQVRLLYRWLRRHYRRHPEDTRVHFMLGAHALLLGDLDTAEERLQFAIEVFGGMDYEALNRLAIVRGRQGRFDEARASLEEVCAVPSLEGFGQPTREELRERARNFVLPFENAVWLASGERGARLFELFEEVFVPKIGPISELFRDGAGSDGGTGSGGRETA